MKDREKRRYLKELGGWLQTLRTQRCIGQDQLSHLAGLARGTVSKIENGIVDPRATTLVRLAKAMRVPAAKLLEICA